MESRFTKLKVKAANLLKSPDKQKEFPKKDDDEDENSQPSTSKGKEEKKSERSKSPSKDQAERWTSSINALLSDLEGVEAFRSYLKDLEDESDEDGAYTKYIDFYMDCEDYKSDFKRLEDTAKRICKIYLAVGAEKEVGTGNGGKSVILGKKLEEEGLKEKALFDEPQEKVKKKLSLELYPNFCKHLKEKLKL
ncbi:hypothetical protein SK128_020178 [Halocaridina rubra]|uniref:RGS domain-containing protein n=1 Tax=Halocaridina rubra TaxID=373956 RepID=A0AAN8X2N7_HALRR